MAKKKTVSKTVTKRYREGHFMSIGMALGILMFSPFGFFVWLMTDSPALLGIGPAIGVTFGVSIGSILEKKYNPNPRPPNPGEISMLKRAVILGMIALLAGVSVFTWMLVA